MFSFSDCVFEYPIKVTSDDIASGFTARAEAFFVENRRGMVVYRCVIFAMSAKGFLCIEEIYDFRRTVVGVEMPCDSE